jgi:aerobic carbon-monoxide dehydrogenase large subunit
VPSIRTERTVTPSPTNPLGVKGIGEAGTIASTPAVVSAVCNAVGAADLDMPLQPETVWRAIQEGGAG